MLSAQRGIADSESADGEHCDCAGGIKALVHGAALPIGAGEVGVQRLFRAFEIAAGDQRVELLEISECEIPALGVFTGDVHRAIVGRSAPEESSESNDAAISPRSLIGALNVI